MTMIVELPDGYNGHTEIFFTEPIDTDDVGRVKLRCARPGAEYLIRWIDPKDLDKYIRDKPKQSE